MIQFFCMHNLNKIKKINQVGIVYRFGQKLNHVCQNEWMTARQV
jgi:hypothetical protein